MNSCVHKSVFNDFAYNYVEEDDTRTIGKQLAGISIDYAIEIYAKSTS